MGDAYLTDLNLRKTCFSQRCKPRYAVAAKAVLIVCSFQKGATANYENAKRLKSRGFPRIS